LQNDNQYKYSLIIPIYKNEAFIVELIEACKDLNERLNQSLEVVFVVDGSPDRSYEILRESLAGTAFRSQLILLSRNFGSFAAIRAGFGCAKGQFFAVMAADMQEPGELVIEFFKELDKGEFDIVVGTRKDRDDPFLSHMFSEIFWAFYRRFIQKDMPPGGVDVFGCNKAFRNNLIELKESNTSLVGLLFWLGFRRKLISYQRKPRKYGKSAWTFNKKLRYLGNSIFAFSDLPIRVLAYSGILGLLVSLALSFVIVAGKVTGLIQVPGYAATVLTILFFAALNSFGLGVIGAYVWRAFENTKQRPESVILAQHEF
jgi:glycosyltransferase involved in cell wall biosynthesis